MIIIICGPSFKILHEPSFLHVWKASVFKTILSKYVVGTLGYVMTEVEDGKPFSQVVKAAKSLGYTEPGLFFFKFNI